MYVFESDYFDTTHVLFVQQVIADADNIEVVSLMSNRECVQGGGRNQAFS